MTEGTKIVIPITPDPAMLFVGRMAANPELADAVFQFVRMACPIAMLGFELGEGNKTTKAARRLELVEKALKGW